MVRHRTRSGATISGNFIKGTIPGSVSYVSSIETCDDTTGPKPYVPHPLLLEKINRGCHIMNGSTGTPGTAGYRLAASCPSGLVLQATHGSLPALAGTNSLATTAASRTNPSRPHVMLPVFFVELRDLPRLIRDTGRLIRDGQNIIMKHAHLLQPGKTASSGYLSWEFGWKPMLADLSKMLDFTSVVDKRMEEFRRLNEVGGLRRRITLQVDTSNSLTTNFVESNLALVSGRQESSTKRTVWATTRWVPTIGGLPPKLEDQRALARRMILGFHSSQISSEFWEALPWSWLIDWFTDVGSFLQASNNSVAHLCGAPCVMTHTVTTQKGTAIGAPSWMHIDSLALASRDTKARSIGVISAFNATLPAITGRQLSILGALNVSRIRR